MTNEGPEQCYHGGAFFKAIGEQFDSLHKKAEIINADVLDAWFPPAPAAQETIRDHLEWIMRTSPPTHSDGLEAVIAEKRGVDQKSILTGSGSSSLIFLAFRQWLNSSSRVLLLDPTYGEYSHVLDKILNCQVDRFSLSRENGYRVDLEALAQTLTEPYDLFVWVNPNSPTGLHVNKAAVEHVLKLAKCQRIWIDETYIEYAGKAESLEQLASQSDNVIVCKSMSKVYALSGMRVAYLCAGHHQLEPLRQLTPPWSVGLPAQIAATLALNADDYYEPLYQETHQLRTDLIDELYALGINEIIHGTGNFILCHLPDDMMPAAVLVQLCREQGLFIRDVSNMGMSIGDNAVRIAVKDAATNKRMIDIMSQIFRDYQDKS